MANLHCRKAQFDCVLLYTPRSPNQYTCLQIRECIVSVYIYVYMYIYIYIYIYTLRYHTRTYMSMHTRIFCLHTCSKSNAQFWVWFCKRKQEPMLTANTKHKAYVNLHHIHAASQAHLRPASAQKQEPKHTANAKTHPKLTWSHTSSKSSAQSSIGQCMKTTMELGGSRISWTTDNK